MIRRGAVKGTYQVRILLNDDDSASRKRAAQAVAPRFRQFATSGLTVEVPPQGEVTLPVAAK